MRCLNILKLHSEASLQMRYLISLNLFTHRDLYSKGSLQVLYLSILRKDLRSRDLKAPSFQICSLHALRDDLRRDPKASCLIRRFPTHGELHSKDLPIATHSHNLNVPKEHHSQDCLRTEAKEKRNDHRQCLMSTCNKPNKQCPVLPQDIL